MVNTFTDCCGSHWWPQYNAEIPLGLEAGITLDIFLMSVYHKWTTCIMTLTAINNSNIPHRNRAAVTPYPMSFKSDPQTLSEHSASSTMANTQSFPSHPASQWMIAFFVNMTGHSSKELFYAFDLHYKHKGLSSMWSGQAASSERLWKLLPVVSVKRKVSSSTTQIVQNYFCENSASYIWKL